MDVGELPPLYRLLESVATSSKQSLSRCCTMVAKLFVTKPRAVEFPKLPGQEPLDGLHFVD